MVAVARGLTGAEHIDEERLVQARAASSERKLFVATTFTS
jgi:hypothetical protein